MKFIALKTDDGKIKGKIAFCCRALDVTRQGYYDYLENRNKSWEYEPLVSEMKKIINEAKCNDTYGRVRMHEALLLKNPEYIKIPSKSTVYRVMNDIGLTHKPRRTPNGITKADKEARKSDDLLRRDFKADEPCEKCVTDITEIKAKDGKLYISVIFDCYDVSALGLAISDNMKAELCVRTVDIHSCKGQYSIQIEGANIQAKNFVMHWQKPKLFKA